MPAHSFQSFVSFAALNRLSRPFIVNSAHRQIARRRHKMPREPQPLKPRCPRTSVYKYVRRRLGKFQGLIYHRSLHNGFPEWINLGLYDSEREAWEAVRHYVRTGERPVHLLPKYIRRTAAGKYVGAVRCKGMAPVVIDPKPTPKAADKAMRRRLLELFGRDGIVRFYPFG